MRIIFYHNPRCSKSRATLDRLQARGLPFTTIEYINNPPDEPTLSSIAAQLPGGAAALLRAKDAAALALNPQNDDAIIAALIAHPALIERPIVVTPLGARLGRPPEAIDEILPEK